MGAATRRARTRGAALLTALAGLAAGLAFAGLGWLGWEHLRQPNWLPAAIVPLHAPLAGDPDHDDAALRFDDLTLRMFVPLALPARALRLRLSNEFGELPLQIGEVHVAWRANASGAAIRPGSDLAVTFGGRLNAAIPPGQTLLSDAVALPPGAPADLAVSIYLPRPTPRASWHYVGGRSGYRSAPGRHVSAVEFPAAASDRSLYFLAAVEVDAPRGTAVWVAFGDSITDGAWHTVDADASWPALWGRAWAARGLLSPVGVLNAGVGGNRLLTAANGPSGLARFDRDVLSLPGVRGVVLLIGINDLGSGPVLGDVDRLIEGQTELIRRARSSGLKVVGATLTPVGGSAYDRPAVEAARQQFNQWIRNSGVFDAVVDFDAVVRDPARPAAFRPGWDSDKLHPSDTGYRAMADALVQQLDRAGLAPASR